MPFFINTCTSGDKIMKNYLFIIVSLVVAVPEKRLNNQVVYMT